MYNGIGLQTARGSGTNGHVQRNFAVLRTRDKHRPRDEPKVDQANREPNKEILEHARKRKIELKCLEFADVLERQGYTQDEIEIKLDSYRATLELTDKEEQEAENARRSVIQETHHLAQANLQKNNLLREAFGISEHFVEGSSFAPERREREAQLKALLEKKYQWVRTPSPSSEIPSDLAEKSKLKKEKKSKKQKKKSSSEKKTKKNEKRKKRKKSVSSSSDSDLSENVSADECESSSDENSVSEKKNKKSKKKTKKKKHVESSSSKSVKKSKSGECETKDKRKKHQKSQTASSSDESAETTSSNKLFKAKDRSPPRARSVSVDKKRRSEADKSCSVKKIKESSNREKKSKRRDHSNDSNGSYGATSDEELKSQVSKLDLKREKKEKLSKRKRKRSRSLNSEESDSDYDEKNCEKSKKKGKLSSSKEKNHHKSRHDRSNLLTERSSIEKVSFKDTQREKNPKDSLLENKRSFAKNKSPSPVQQYSKCNEDQLTMLNARETIKHRDDQESDNNYSINNSSKVPKDSWIIEKINGKDVVRKVDDNKKCHIKKHATSEKQCRNGKSRSRSTERHHEKNSSIDAEKNIEGENDKPRKKKSKRTSSSSDESRSRTKSDDRRTKSRSDYDKKKQYDSRQLEKSESNIKQTDSSSDSSSSDSSDSSDSFDIQPRLSEKK